MALAQGGSPAAEDPAPDGITVMTTHRFVYQHDGSFLPWVAASACTVLLLATPASAETAAEENPSHGADVLPVVDAPATQPLPDEWSEAGHVHDSDFEAALDGAYPAGWRSMPSESRKSFLKVRRTREGGKVLQIKGRAGFQLDLDGKLRGGRLRLSFDMLQLGAPKSSFAVRLMERRSAPDLGWQEPYEEGPVILFEWPENSGDRIDLSAPVSGKKGTYAPVGRIKPRQWTRIVIVGDLQTNRSKILIDGQVQDGEVLFTDHKWFGGADRLQLDASNANVLLDNLTLLHLPGDDETGARATSSQPPPRLIPTRLLESSPVLDGVLDDPAWTQAYHTDRFYRLTAEPWFEQFKIEAWLGVTSDALYLATRIWPTEIPGFPYTKDFVDPRKRPGLKAVELQVFPTKGTAYGAGLFLSYTGEGKYEQRREGGIPWNPDWQVVTKPYDDHWVAEMRVPLVELTVGGVSHRDWGVNLYIDRSRGTMAPKAILWPHVGGPNTSSRFALLSGAGVAAESRPTCRLELPESALTGKAPVRVKVGRPAAIRSKRFRVKVVVEHLDGTRVDHSKTFDVARDQAKVELALNVPAAQSGDAHFQAHLYAVGGSGEGAEPLAKSVRHLLTVLPLGSIQARPQYNYFTSESVARIRCELMGKPVPPGSRAIVAVAQSGREIAEFSSPVSDSPFVVEFPLEGVSAGGFEAGILLSGPGGARLGATTVHLVRRVARHNEVKLRWDNVTIVGGKPFFPIIVWGHRPYLAHQIGANVVLTMRDTLSRRDEEQIRYMRRHGIHLIMTDLMWPRMFNSSGADKTFWADPGKYRGPFADDAMLLGYFVEDEPGVEDGKPSQTIVNHADALRQMDPYHPTFISNSIGWDRFYAYSPVVDTIGAHIYPAWIRYNERLVADATRMLRRASHGRRPVWITVQAFHFRNNRVHPTPAELRHQIYAALVNGANGIGFWGVGDRPGFIDEDIRGTSSLHPLWQQLKRTLPVVRRLSPVLMSQEQAGAGVAVDHDDVAIMTRRHEGRLYIWLVNMTNKKVGTVLTLPGERGTLSNEIHPGGTHAFSGGRCPLSLEPLQPMVLSASR